jgi:hypothetical protein
MHQRNHLYMVGAAVVWAAAACGGSSTSPSSDAGHDGTAPGNDCSTGGADAANESGSTSDSGSIQDTGSPLVDAADQSAPVVPTPSPDFVWYVLDETTGTVAHDSSPNQYDVTVTGITWATGGVFDGTGCGQTVVASGFRTPPMTMSAWVKPATRTDAPNTGALQPYPPSILGGDVPGVGGYSLGLSVWSAGSALSVEGVSPCTQGGLCVANSTQNALAGDAGVDSGLPSCTSATSCKQGFVADTEYFVTATIDAPPDGGTMPAAQVYVNGAIFDLATAYIPPASATPPLRLGCHNDDTSYGVGRFFEGRLRDVRVYTRALPADEVQQLYVNGPTLEAPPRSDAGPKDAAMD